MHEEVNEKSVAFAFKAGKITAQMLAKAMQKYLNHTKSGKVKDNKLKPGKISMKKLAMETGGNTANIEITNDNIKAFDPIAREFGIRYALRKHEKTGRKYVFFNAKSADAMTAAFKKFTEKQLRTASRPSMRSELRKLIEQVKNMTVNKTKHKDRGQEL